MSIYKDCDIRGIYGEEFDENEAYLIGRAVGTLHKGETLAIGGDVRISTPVLKEKLMNGLMESGANLVDLGMVPTPVFYYALKTLGVDGGIIVTASHNPPKYNGFKLMFGEHPVVPEDIAKIESLAKSRDFSQGAGTVVEKEVSGAYLSWIQTMCKKGGLKIVLDCCNGATSEIAPEAARSLGYDVVPLYCEFDGNFPNRDPNPAVYKNLADLQSKVIETGADFGAGFDGDGDRVVFVDDKGRILQSERSLAIFIGEYFKDGPSSVVYDLKSSSVVRDATLKMGGTPIMERSGHAFIKKTFLKNNSKIAGEISGHFFFGELGYDDGIYAMLKMAEIASKEKLSVIADSIPATLITPDIRVFCPYDQRDGWLDRVKKMAEDGDFSVSLLDGVRVDMPDGWLIVRKSVTEQGVTIRIEARDEACMASIKALLSDTLPEIKDNLN